MLTDAFILVPGDFTGKQGGPAFWHAIESLGTVGIVIIVFGVVLVLLAIFLRLRNPGGGMGGWPPGGRMGR